MDAATGQGAPLATDRPEASGLELLPAAQPTSLPSLVAAPLFQQTPRLRPLASEDRSWGVARRSQFTPPCPGGFTEEVSVHDTGVFRGSPAGLASPCRMQPLETPLGVWDPLSGSATSMLSGPSGAFLLTQGVQFWSDGYTGSPDFEPRLALS